MFKKLPCLKVNLESLKAQLLQEPVRVDIHLENLSLTNYFPSMKHKEGYIKGVEKTTIGFRFCTPGVL